MTTRRRARDQYIVRKHPRNGKWYVFGWLGDNQWMQMVGFRLKSDAERWATRQPLVDAAMRAELLRDGLPEGGA